MTTPTAIHLHSNLHVAVSSTSFSKNLDLRKKLKKKFLNSFFNESSLEFSEQELCNFLKNADAAIVGAEFITEKVLREAKRLKIISKYGVGLDNINLESLKKRNITLGWTGGVNQRSVSELTLCFMLGLFRNVFQSAFKLKNTRWEKDGGQQLTGKTIGIVGCGHIGSDLIKLLTPFKCSLLVNDIVDKSQFCLNHGAIQTNIETLVSESNLISLHVPLTTLTKDMVDEKFLSKMKSDAYLINTSRGGVVNEKDLKKALEQKRIAGAAIDVFAEEPPSDEKFIKLPNLASTPHIGGNAREAVEAMGLSAIDHLTAFFKRCPSPS